MSEGSKEDENEIEDKPRPQSDLSMHDVQKGSANITICPNCKRLFLSDDEYKQHFKNCLE